MIHGKTSQEPNAATLPCEARLFAVHELQHGFVRIVDLGVAEDAVVGEAGEDLVVAGIGEDPRVRDVHQVPVESVAVELTLAGNYGPEEWQKGFAADVCVVVPELLRERLGLIDVVFVADEKRIGPAVQFLPAQPVERNEDDVLSLPRLRE